MHLLALGAYWHPVTVNDTSWVRVLLNGGRCQWVVAMSWLNASVGVR